MLETKGNIGDVLLQGDVLLLLLVSHKIFIIWFFAIAFISGVLSTGLTKTSFIVVTDLIVSFVLIGQMVSS